MLFSPNYNLPVEFLLLIELHLGILPLVEFANGLQALDAHLDVNLMDKWGIAVAYLASFPEQVRFDFDKLEVYLPVLPSEDGLVATMGTDVYYACVGLFRERLAESAGSPIKITSPTSFLEFFLFLDCFLLLL